MNMKVMEILRDSDVKKQQFPLFKIMSIIRDEHNQHEDKKNALNGLITSSNIFASAKTFDEKMDALILFSRHLEVFSESDENLHQIQMELIKITGIK